VTKYCSAGCASCTEQHRARVLTPARGGAGLPLPAAPLSWGVAQGLCCMGVEPGVVEAVCMAVGLAPPAALAPAEGAAAEEVWRCSGSR